ncbi:helix-turn-helix domain-containing protein [Streptomyces agglomeratus]|uniref:helix-turn-helix domain-containing protein n=1 Tax=Streptomyces agglomeratus TaxID=285458 RepID=UPI000A5FEA17|nr:helix-turn-helix transcriptional regulator [Streptomyces agglomeratus]
MDAQPDPESQVALSPEEALVELRRQLKAGRLKKRLSMDQMKTRSGLGRTVVSQAFSPNAPPPSAATVNALADALGLDTNYLLDLLYTATTVPVGARPAPRPTPPQRYSTVPGPSVPGPPSASESIPQSPGVPTDRSTLVLSCLPMCLARTMTSCANGWSLPPPSRRPQHS